MLERYCVSLQYALVTNKLSDIQAGTNERNMEEKYLNNLR